MAEATSHSSYMSHSPPHIGRCKRPPGTLLETGRLIKPVGMLSEPIDTTSKSSLELLMATGGCPPETNEFCHGRKLPTRIGKPTGWPPMPRWLSDWIAALDGFWMN